jgi:hypothetical protein
MMKSNSTVPVPASAINTVVPVYESLLLKGWSHSWNVSINQKNDPFKTATRMISEYYFNQSISLGTKSDSNSNSLALACPRHHALILASFGSSSKLVSREFPVSVMSDVERSCLWRQFAFARVHDPQHVTPLTEISSNYQKNHLKTLSAITSLLITRLIMMTPKIISAKTKKHHVEITNRYVHSAFAAECLIGNRYYSVLTKCSSYDIEPIGFVKCNIKSNLTQDDVTPHALCATLTVLKESYDKNIDRLMSMIEMFKRGFVSVDQIRDDPEFIQMLVVFWRSINQRLKTNDDIDGQEKMNLDFDKNRLLYNQRINAKRITMIAMIAELAAIAPQLYSYDVARIFDNAGQCYVNYVKTARSTWMRLAGDGSTASLLAFASIEPRMVTEDYAPKIGGAPAEFHALTLKSCANYIPSSHPVFGALRMKHACHIMRTADAVNRSSPKVHKYDDAPHRGVEREITRFRHTYAPFRNEVEYVRNSECLLDPNHTFDETCKNSGIIISAQEVVEEFKERVYSRGMGYATRCEYYGMTEHDSDPEEYGDDDYDSYDYSDDYGDYDSDDN